MYLEELQLIIIYVYLKFNIFCAFEGTTANYQLY